jgi:PTS system nitrogen regulatory IIA component
MGNEMMDLEQVAVYLQRDQREVSKMATRGYLPAQKIAGQWRFARAEINHWIETQLHGFDEKQLSALETEHTEDAEVEPLLISLLSPASMAVPLPASTRASVLKELVGLAEQSWHVYDPAAVLNAIKQREEMGSTALTSGVAIPHPRRPLPGALGESLIAYGRTASGIPFGESNGGLTDVYFLVCCRDDSTHLRVLTRLSRLLLRPSFIDELRAAGTVQATWEMIRDAEAALLSESPA